MGDFNGDGARGTEDLILFLTVFGTACPSPFGCTDVAAENYNPDATEDDGTCEYDLGPCDGLETLNYGGVEYDLAIIADQCWFTSNLRTTHFANGDSIPHIANSFDWYLAGAGATAAACDYSNSASSSLLYGSLYNSFAVQDERGLCPTGWHVPTDPEWMALEMALGMSETDANAQGFRGTDEGAALKSSSTDTPPWNGTNLSGLAFPPSGQRYNFGSFNGQGLVSLSWTSTSMSGTAAWARRLLEDSNQIDRSPIENGFGGTVRCIKDSEP
jgi:uncharacterized protein (TIGR02145 family)